MRYNTFGRTGLSVSALGFGGGPIGYLEIEQRRITSILNLLLDSGVNLIDTAAAYGASEVSIGKAISHRRDQFILVSKCGREVEGVKGAPWSAELITQTVDRALRRLKTDHLDVMLLHSCSLEILKLGEAIGALAQARNAGKIRFAGYSGDNEAATYAASLAEVAVIETSVNICDQANIDNALAVAREKNAGVLAKRSIANSAWKAPEQQAGLYRSYSQTYAERFHAMGLALEDLDLCGNPAQAWPEIALRFTLSQPGVHCAIVGTTHPLNAEANLRAVQQGPLPLNTVEKLRSAFRIAETRTGTRWPGLT